MFILYSLISLLCSFLIIIIVNLPVKGFFCYLHLFIYVNISLFHRVYFTSFFDHRIEQNIFLFVEKRPLGDLQNSYSKSMLTQPAFIRSKLTIKTLEQTMKYVQVLRIKIPE